jgi:hypothetical protein
MAAFVQQNAPVALQIEKETGIRIGATGHPGNETGWGSQMAGNNYFGIKAAARTPGPTPAPWAPRSSTASGQHQRHVQGVRRL